MAKRKTKSNALVQLIAGIVIILVITLIGGKYDSNLLEKKLKTSAWDNDVVEAKVLYNNGKIGVCIRDSKNNGIIGTENQVKEQSSDLKYDNITSCASIPN